MWQGEDRGAGVFVPVGLARPCFVFSCLLFSVNFVIICAFLVYFVQFVIFLSFVLCP